jgi:hypothetical protein
MTAAALVVIAQRLAAHSQQQLQVDRDAAPRKVR